MQRDPLLLYVLFLREFLSRWFRERWNCLKFSYNWVLIMAANKFTKTVGRRHKNVVLKESLFLNPASPSSLRVAAYCINVFLAPPISFYFPLYSQFFLVWKEMRVGWIIALSWGVAKLVPFCFTISAHNEQVYSAIQSKWIRERTAYVLKQGREFQLRT